MASGLKTFGALCVFIAGLSQLCLAVSIQQYYEYDSRTEGWWRLHTEPATWLEAKLRCQIEGGILTSPTTVTLTSSMISKMGWMRSVFTGIHANSSGGDFMSIDGIPLSNVITPWARGEPNSLSDDEDCLAMSNAGELSDVSCASELPYFCYQSKAAMSENVCGTNNGYTLEPRTGSCYKFHNAAIQWRRAAMKCASERAHLAIINSEEESQVLKELFDQNPPSSILFADNNNYASIGILDWNESGHWLTVFGETLDEAGYKKWASGEPNRYYRDEYCGSITRSGELNDTPCNSYNFPYICEISPKLIPVLLTSY